MNLVAEEYIVCQKERKGALIISEFAGVRSGWQQLICALAHLG